MAVTVGKKQTPNNNKTTSIFMTFYNNTDIFHLNYTEGNCMNQEMLDNISHRTTLYLFLINITVRFLGLDVPRDAVSLCTSRAVFCERGSHWILCTLSSLLLLRRESVFDLD